MTADSPRRSDSWLWLLLLFSVASLVEASFYGQLNAFTPLYLPRLGISPEQVTQWTGLMPAIASAIGIPLIPLWGALADRYARQPVIVRSFVAHLLAGLLMLVAGNILVFTLGRAITSFALGNTGLMLTTLAERTPKERTGLAFAIMNGASPLGVFLGPLIGGPIVDERGFTALLGIAAILMTGVIVAMIFGYRDTFKGTNRGPLLQMAWDSMVIIWRAVRLRALFGALFLLFAGWVLAFTYIALVVTSLYRGDNPGRAIGLVMGLGGLSGMVIAPILGALADRFGHWRVLFAGAVAAIFLWPIPMFMGDLTAFTVAWVVLNGVVSGVFAISFSVLASEVPDAVRGRVMSFAFLPTNLGFMIGPAIGSIITRSSVFNVFPTAAVLTALGVGVLALAARLPQTGVEEHAAVS